MRIRQKKESNYKSSQETNNSLHIKQPKASQRGDDIVTFRGNGDINVDSHRGSYQNKEDEEVVKTRQSQGTSSMASSGTSFNKKVVAMSPKSKGKVQQRAITESNREN